MKRFGLGLAIATCVVLTARPGMACLWDSDTLALERGKFPSVLELITGKFLRHSPEFYQWRIQDRTRRIESDPNDPALYDDLAVAYHKVGDNQKAIETILQKEKLFPGLYETYSNLGTFYIFTGELDKSVEQISKAIEINPDAHFGREVYQKLLVEYILSNGHTIKLPMSKSDRAPGETNFSSFVKMKLHGVIPYERVPLEGEEQAAAVKGVLGMMRFADYNSPILLEAIGDLMLQWSAKPELEYGDAGHLGSRAYLKASYAVDDEKARKAYRDMAANAALRQRDMGRSLDRVAKLARLEEELKSEIQEANDWYEEVRADELAWIAAGLDVDAEFARKYYDDPALTGPIDEQVRIDILGLHVPRFQVVIAGACAGALLVAAVGVAAYVLMRSRRRPVNQVDPGPPTV